MGNLLRDHMMIAAQLLFFSVLLILIIYVSGVSRDLMVIHDNKEALKTEMSVERELSSYTNGVLKGEDILLFLRKYPKEFSVSIETDSRNILLKGGVHYTGDILTKQEEYAWNVDDYVNTGDLCSSEDYVSGIGSSKCMGVRSKMQFVLDKEYVASIKRFDNNSRQGIEQIVFSLK